MVFKGAPLGLVYEICPVTPSNARVLASTLVRAFASVVPARLIESAIRSTAS